MASILALAMLGQWGGWLILLDGGFHRQVRRYSAETTFVDGGPALLMACLMFGMAALAAMAALEGRGVGRQRSWWGAVAVLAPPVWFAVARGL